MTETGNHELRILERQLVRALRGGVTQVQLSRELGFSFNQVHLWEQGRRQISWRRFLHLCKTVKTPIGNLLKEFYDVTDEAAESHILRVLLQGKRGIEAAPRMGLSPSRYSRLVSGKAKPSLQQVLRAMDFAQNDLAEFIDKLAGQGKVPCIQPELEARRKLKATIDRLPYIAAVVAGLDLKEFPLGSCQPGQLASRLGLTAAEETQALSVLKSETEPMEEGLNSPFGTASEAVVKYWLERALRRQPRDGSKSSSRCSVFGISHAGLEKVKLEEEKFYSAVAKILEADTKPHDHVVALSGQLTVLGE